MNYVEVHDFLNNNFYPLISDKFKEIYGENVFLHNLTTDKETYNSTNGSMYKYYMYIVNNLAELPETPKYKKRDDNYDYILEMYNDLKESKDPLKWMIEFIPPKFLK